ncbi:MAG: 2-hydroxyacyl-CoA dehydratase [Candidatus Abyssobacteria bacterium SURF_5]|uniref:2-hydroxyacyl-CoA dehydratase n=1 Tax=Abyssobacteria bacterium (strain SURF_5) TaxID=2093360 RepID=A0A3A4NL36_ABYX5|nr:MAG: 2-hydroxyacyl-CoA dehydratase [Candidatus Abyssubacteria bacterium SURF_5]
MSTQSSVPPIRAAARMRELMSLYFLEAKNAADNKRKVAWVTGGGPVELLIAMDVIPVYPENHAAMCGASKMGAELCEIAETRGYSRDTCSYFRCDIGSIESGRSPISGLPRPDFLLCCTNTCGTVMKWYEVLARYFQVPLVLFDTPYIHEELTEHSLTYMTCQIERAIAEMESITGNGCSVTKLEQVVELSGRAIRLWGEILGACKMAPSPITAFDGFILMAPIVTLRGTQLVVEFYEELLGEIQKRVDEGVAAVPGERYRLLWDNLPIWFKLRDLSRKFAELKACVAASTYLNGWVSYELDAGNPIEALGRAYATAFVNINLRNRAEMMRDIIEQYSVDGVIFHSNRSCKPYSLGQYVIKEILSGAGGVPGIVIEGDMNDERAYAEGPALTRIEAFLETLHPESTRGNRSRRWALN